MHCLPVTLQRFQVRQYNHGLILGHWTRTIFGLTNLLFKYNLYIHINDTANTGFDSKHTVKILKIGTPKIITIIVLQLKQLDFTVQYCVQKMQTE